MVANARMVFSDGILVVPAETPYDRQQLVEHVRARIGRQQQVRVRVDRTTWLVDRIDPSGRLVCSSCAQRPTYGVCRRVGKTQGVHCLTCALARPHLTIAFLTQLPEETILRDVQAHYAYGGEWVAWTRWPQATPAQIIDDIHLQRRFAPVLTWRCAEIRLPSRTARSVPRTQPGPVRLAAVRRAVG